MALQLLEFRSPDGAEMVVGVEGVGDERSLAVGGGDPALRGRFQRRQIGSYLIEDILDLDKAGSRNTPVRQIVEESCGFLDFLFDRRGGAAKLRGIGVRKQGGSGGDD